MDMFCNQCQETGKGTGCEIAGVCGKSAEVANLQDLLIYTLKGISQIIIEGQVEVASLKELNHQLLKSLFMTITNANFDDAAFEKQINKIISMRDELRENVSITNFHDAALFQVSSMEDMLFKASYVDVFGAQLASSNNFSSRSKDIRRFGSQGRQGYSFSWSGDYFWYKGYGCLHPPCLEFG